MAMLHKEKLQVASVISKGVILFAAFKRTQLIKASIKLETTDLYAVKDTYDIRISKLLPAKIMPVADVISQSGIDAPTKMTCSWLHSSVG